MQNLLDGYPSLPGRTIFQSLRPVDSPVSGELETEPRPMLFPPGLVSIPGDAVLGHRGVVFLTSGTNNVFCQYTLPTVGDAHQGAAQSWCELFGRCRGAAAARGVTSVQTIIPDSPTWGRAACRFGSRAGLKNIISFGRPRLTGLTSRRRAQTSS